MEISSMSEEAKTIRVVLADDHELVLEGLRALLRHEPDLKVVAAVTDGETLLTSVRRLKPDMVVLDLRIPKIDGLTCLRIIKEESPHTRVLILTAFDDRESVREAFELGADGFALKTEPPALTVAAIREVFHGRMVFPRLAARHILQRQRAQQRMALTPREMEVLALVAEGLTNAQIAQRLVVSQETVKFHLRNIYQKLGVSTRTEAAAYYYRYLADQS